MWLRSTLELPPEELLEPLRKEEAEEGGAGADTGAGGVIYNYRNKGRVQFPMCWREQEQACWRQRETEQVCGNRWTRFWK